ncbi:MAG: AlpA family phage regulatory protein [Phycisphaerae bacterium]|jgi:predicted DNA-binding transcriptional regulator AlpA
MTTATTPISVQPLAVSAKDAAMLLGISKAQVWKLHAQGKLPLPIRLGTKAPRWLVAELRAWSEAGCPDRQVWERAKTATRRGC